MKLIKAIISIICYLLLGASACSSGNDSPSNGDGKREIASQYYPLIGPYAIQTPKEWNDVLGSLKTSHTFLTLYTFSASTRMPPENTEHGTVSGTRRRSDDKDREDVKLRCFYL